jgi:hypothetical protein
MYANQFLSAIPWSKVPQCDEEELAIEEQLVETGCIVCGKKAPEKMEQWKAAFWVCDCP